MIENAKLNLYDIKECGCYEDGANASLFCDLNEAGDWKTIVKEAEKIDEFFNWTMN